jgi:hypothetical protein
VAAPDRIGATSREVTHFSHWYGAHFSLIHRHNRRALDHTTALARIPCRKAALAHNLDHSDAAHNPARNVFAGCRDPLRVGTHRVLQKLRGTDR